MMVANTKTRPTMEQLQISALNGQYGIDYRTALYLQCDGLCANNLGKFADFMKLTKARQRKAQYTLMGKGPEVASRTIKKRMFTVDCAYVAQWQTFVQSQPEENRIEVGLEKSNTIHELWFNDPLYDYYAPPKLNAFAWLYCQSNTDDAKVRAFVNQNDLLSQREQCEYPLIGTEILQERLREMYDDEGRICMRRGKKPIPIAVNLDIDIASIVDCAADPENMGKSRQELRELQGRPGRLSPQIVMYLAFLLQLPLDYFFVKDYYTPTSNRIVFTAPNGTPRNYTRADLTYLAAAIPQFLALSPADADRCLAEMLRKRLELRF